MPGLTARALTDAEIAPVRPVGDWAHALERHGPTLAFKDMALQLLPHLLTLSAKKNGETREIFILVATSGDTGKAALEGFLDVPGTRCCVFYPREGVSQAQRLQMVTTGGANTHVIAVNGNFDDAQTGVKRIFADRHVFAETMAAQGACAVLRKLHQFQPPRAAGGVLFFRLRRFVESGRDQAGRRGEFLCADGQLRRHSGGGLRGQGRSAGGSRLICASNENNVLTDFINMRVYDI